MSASAPNVWKGTDSGTWVSSGVEYPRLVVEHQETKIRAEFSSDMALALWKEPDEFSVAATTDTLRGFFRRQLQSVTEVTWVKFAERESGLVACPSHLKVRRRWQRFSAGVRWPGNKRHHSSTTRINILSTSLERWSQSMSAKCRVPHLLQPYLKQQHPCSSGVLPLSSLTFPVIESRSLEFHRRQLEASGKAQNALASSLFIVSRDPMPNLAKCAPNGLWVIRLSSSTAITAGAT